MRTEYVVTAGIARTVKYRSGSQFGAIEYAEAYAGRHRENVSVYAGSDVLFSIEIVDGEIVATDHEMQQAAWESFIEGDDCVIY